MQTRRRDSVKFDPGAALCIFCNMRNVDLTATASTVEVRNMQNNFAPLDRKTLET